MTIKMVFGWDKESFKKWNFVLVRTRTIHGVWLKLWYDEIPRVTAGKMLSQQKYKCQAATHTHYEVSIIQRHRGNWQVLSF